MEGLKQLFERKKQEVPFPRSIAHDISANRPMQNAPALVTFVTAGYPRIQDTVPVMLAMQEGGANIIELGVPFSDPIADGPAIQETNAVCTRPFRPSPNFPPHT